MPIEKHCQVCGKKFSVPPVRALTAKTCSNACAISVRAKSRERKETCVCAHCGKTFQSPRSHASRRVYCSKGCQWNDDFYKEKKRGLSSGNKNAMWKGGETIHADGYIYTWCEWHPLSSNNYVFHHRLVMESWLRESCPDSIFLSKIGEKLYLSIDSVVHHIDFNKKNNDRNNLVVMSASSHSTLHNGYLPDKGKYWPETASLKVGLNANSTTKKET